jgi:hypothetical protein
MSPHELLLLYTAPTLYHNIMHTFSTNVDYRNWASNIGKNP